jgi:hypothetical protein
LGYGSWILLGLALRAFSKRHIQNLDVRPIDYSYLCLSGVVNVVVWFSYPLNIAFSVLFVIMSVISYRAYKHRLLKEAEVKNAAT